jgi:hypothetical protein
MEGRFSGKAGSCTDIDDRFRDNNRFSMLVLNIFQLGAS